MDRPEWLDMEVEEFKAWFEELPDDEKMLVWAQGAAMLKEYTAWWEGIVEVLRPAVTKIVKVLAEVFADYLGG